MASSGYSPVLVVGGGPTGLLTAYGLARLGISCILAEMNLETTKWPKMDLTNCRSMEILRMYGLADEYRRLDGVVGQDYQADTIFYTSMAPGGELIAKWVLRLCASLECQCLTRNSRYNPIRNGERLSPSTTMALRLQNQASGVPKSSSRRG